MFRNTIITFALAAFALAGAFAAPVNAVGVGDALEKTERTAEALHDVQASCEQETDRLADAQTYIDRATLAGSYDEMKFNLDKASNKIDRAERNLEGVGHELKQVKKTIRRLGNVADDLVNKRLSRRLGILGDRYDEAYGDYKDAVQTIEAMRQQIDEMING